ncbi:hypothetical protein BN1723_016305 [Verticillium longisporum]|uniref:Uncharacterized protein n=1 Tax=Verticillium longisporum TaxID=100787 RepID=A0A0G4NBN1_VERLO|nr:hypothetical protein BN1723_016305 [Verticillium longisporum]
MCVSGIYADFLVVKKGINNENHTSEPYVMASATETEIREFIRPTIQLAAGKLVDQAFVKEAITLAEQDPSWSGLFFAEFLGEYYTQVAMGNCGDMGDDALGMLALRDRQATNLLHNMFSHAAEIYRQCHRDQEAVTSLEAIGTSGSAYLQDLVKRIRQSRQNQAGVAASIVRDARTFRLLHARSANRSPRAMNSSLTAVSE